MQLLRVAVVQRPAKVRMPVQVRSKDLVGPQPWIKPGDDPSVIVAEQPVEGGVVDACDDGSVRTGSVEVMVRPGAQAIIGPDRAPWKVGLPDDEAVALYRSHQPEGL